MPSALANLLTRLLVGHLRHLRWALSHRTLLRHTACRGLLVLGAGLLTVLHEIS
jgi:hypothetical protein